MKTKGEKKAKIVWGTKYLLTINHPEITTLLLTASSSDFPAPTVAGKVAVEIGENGNLHKHVYVVFRRSIRRDTLINRYKQYGVQVDNVTPGTEQNVINYIGNPDKEVSKGCTIVSDYAYQWGNLEVSQGVRSDLTQTDVALWQMKEAIDSGATIKDLYDDFFHIMVRYGKGLTDYHKMVKYERMETDRSLVLKETANLLHENIELENTILQQVAKNISLN